MNYLKPERLDLLARDYALGTLHGRARRRFERVLREQPAAAQAVTGWQRQFDTLAEGAPRLAPRAAVWNDIEHRLFAPKATAQPPWWRAWLSRRSLGGALAGAALAVVVLRQQPGWVGLETEYAVLPASYVGLLTDTTGQPAVLASSRRHGRLLTVKLLRPVAVPPGRVAQLWALPRDGGAAFPVGVVPAQGSGTIALADSSEKLFSNVGRLAVSFETAPAAPGALPSGDFVLSGHCVKLW